MKTTIQIPSDLLRDNRLRPAAKLLYGEIVLDVENTGDCTRSNEYFGKLYDVHNCSISGWVKQLHDFGYINLTYRKVKDSNLVERVITIKD